MPIPPFSYLYNDKGILTGGKFKYEKLRIICFNCGIVGHGLSFCPEYSGVRVTKSGKMWR